jgi:hypothetical protein
MPFSVSGTFTWQVLCYIFAFTIHILSPILPVQLLGSSKRQLHSGNGSFKNVPWTREIFQYHHIHFDYHNTMASTSMPCSTPLTPDQFIATQTRQANLAELPTDEQSCPICHIKYGEAEGRTLPEAAVRIAGCNHVFGRRCLQQHVHGGFAYSKTCPQCRAKLFGPATADDLQAVSARLRELEQRALVLEEGIATARQDLSAASDAVERGVSYAGWELQRILASVRRITAESARIAQAVAEMRAEMEEMEDDLWRRTVATQDEFALRFAEAVFAGADDSMLRAIMEERDALLAAEADDDNDDDDDDDVPSLDADMGECGGWRVRAGG